MNKVNGAMVVRTISEVLSKRQTAICAQSAGDKMKVREVGLLKGTTYSDNKLKVKKVFKAHGLKFNQGALHSGKIFLWQSEEAQVEGRFTKDEEGVTIRAELIIEGEERTPAFDELKECVLELGGSWEIASKKELQEERAQEIDDKYAAFEETWKHLLLNEERKARDRRFEHCPILRPMVKQYLQVRDECFGVNDNTTIDDVIEEIYQTINEERGE